MTLNQLLGIGLRYPHYQCVLEQMPPVGWFEVHPENFFYNKGPSETLLKQVAEHYPISLHGVGLSLGSPELSKQHLKRLKALINVVNPFLVSEHLSWNRVDNIALPDLFPIPYTEESFTIFKKNVNDTQDFLGCEILIENPSSYFEYQTSEMHEVDFLVKLCQETHAKVLLDVNNIYVSCTNHGWDPIHYLSTIPKDLVKEIHLAGHSVHKIDNHTAILVDTHDGPVCNEVWALYEQAIKRFGAQPTLFEWDTNIPSLEKLVEEALKATHYVNAIKTTTNFYASGIE